MFAEEQLPAWVEKNPVENTPELFQPPEVDMSALNKIGEDFKKACEVFAQKHTEPAKSEPVVVPYKFKRHDDIV